MQNAARARAAEAGAPPELAWPEEPPAEAAPQGLGQWPEQGAEDAAPPVELEWPKDDGGAAVSELEWPSVSAEEGAPLAAAAPAEVEGGPQPLGAAQGSPSKSGLPPRPGGGGTFGAGAPARAVLSDGAGAADWGAPGGGDEDAWSRVQSCSGAPSALAPAVRDQSARMWGWRDGAPCGFKGRGGEPLDAGVVGLDAEWETAPVCGTARTGANSARDAWGKPWGWQSGRGCAYRGANGAEVAADWEAPAQCQGAWAPGAASRDMWGRWWGLEAGEQCLFYGTQGGAPAA
ncbi:MAG: hypothetical protein J3K34DRAFT_407944 [Monoraphidium minutum]|nr:MAG: hypothetical protein J3K34DRAFT_407944 [Monoraphidium minutum]